MKLIIVLSLLLSVQFFGQQKSASGIKHSFMISGQKTMEVDEDSKVVWEFHGGSKDAAKLSNGNFLITYGDKVIEVTPDKKQIWEYKKSINNELMSAQRLENGNTLVTEQGDKPRLVEVDAEAKVVLSVPIQPETNNSHMQSRMSRKLANGNYLVPHRIMPFVKEYDATGRAVKIFRLDSEELGGAKAKNGSFRAVRLNDGSTVITCASGNRMVMFDESGKLIWQLTSSEIGGILKDVCGLEVLKSGNFLVSCYGNTGKDDFKIMEITRDKKIVWTYQNNGLHNVHNLQVLTTNGQPE